MGDVLKVHDSRDLLALGELKIANESVPCIIVVLAGEHDIVEVGRMAIGKRMLISIPSSIAQIKATHESNVTVDETQLFVMRPIENDVFIHAIDCLEPVGR